MQRNTSAVHALEKTKKNHCEERDALGNTKKDHIKERNALEETKRDHREERDALEKTKKDLRKALAELAKAKRSNYPGSWWTRNAQVRQSCMRAQCEVRTPPRKRLRSGHIC